MGCGSVRRNTVDRIGLLFPSLAIYRSRLLSAAGTHVVSAVESVGLFYLSIFFHVQGNNVS